MSRLTAIKRVPYFQIRDPDRTVDGQALPPSTSNQTTDKQPSHIESNSSNGIALAKTQSQQNSVIKQFSQLRIGCAVEQVHRNRNAFLFFQRCTLKDFC